MFDFLVEIQEDGLILQTQFFKGMSDPPPIRTGVMGVESEVLVFTLGREFVGKRSHGLDLSDGKAREQRALYAYRLVYLDKRFISAVIYSPNDCGSLAAVAFY
jgi:hypothetical protein